MLTLVKWDVSFSIKFSTLCLHSTLLKYHLFIPHFVPCLSSLSPSAADKMSMTDLLKAEEIKKALEAFAGL